MKFKQIIIALLIILAIGGSAYAEKGKLNVVTDVENAEIYIDGTFVGKNSVNNYPLEEGSHYVQVKYENKIRYAEKVYIYAGEVKTITSEHFVDLKTKTPSRGALDREAKRLRDTKGYTAFGLHAGPPASGLSFKWWVWDRMGLQFMGMLQDDGTDRNNQVGARLLIGFADKVFANQALSSYFAIGAGTIDYADEDDAFTGTMLDAAFGLELGLFGLFWDLELGFEALSSDYSRGDGSESFTGINFRGGVHYYF